MRKEQKYPMFVVWSKNVLVINILVQKYPYCYLIGQTHFPNKYIIIFFLTHSFSNNVFVKLANVYLTSIKKKEEDISYFIIIIFYRYININ